MLLLYDQRSQDVRNACDEHQEANAVETSAGDSVLLSSYVDFFYSDIRIRSIHMAIGGTLGQSFPVLCPCLTPLRKTDPVQVSVTLNFYIHS